MTLRVVKDSVAGRKCLVIYKNGHPAATIWDGEDTARIVAHLGMPELEALLTTIKLFNMTFDQIAVTAEAFCKEREENQ